MQELDQVQGSRYVGLVVTKRDLGGFADGLQACKVNTGREGIGLKDMLEGRTVQEVDLMKDQGALRVLGKILGPDKGFFRRVAQVVDNDESFAEVEKLNDSVRANEAGTTGDKDGLLVVLLVIRDGHGHLVQVRTDVVWNGD